MSTEHSFRPVVQKLLDSGKYYENAFTHYYSKYAVSFNHRLWLIVALSYIFSLILIVMANIQALFPIQVKVPFVQYTDRIYEDVSHIKSMYDVLKFEKNGKKKDDIQNMVSKYLLKSYVENRENISNIDLGHRNLYIKNNSSYRVYNDYMQNFKRQIGDTKKLNKMEVNVTSINLLKSVALVSNAVVSVQLKDVSTKSVINTNARIQYRISDVVMAHKGLIPLEFMVINYERF